MFAEEVIVEGQMSQRDRGAAFQGETSVHISSLGNLSVQLGQRVEMRVKFGDDISRPLEPER